MSNTHEISYDIRDGEKINNNIIPNHHVSIVLAQQKHGPIDRSVPNTVKKR